MSCIAGNQQPRPVMAREAEFATEGHGFKVETVAAQKQWRGFMLWSCRLRRVLIVAAVAESVEKEGRRQARTEVEVGRRSSRRSVTG